jgi:nucleotide-binding universal stress UspA family protein
LSIYIVYNNSTAKDLAAAVKPREGETMVSKILVLYDGSAVAKKALKVGIELSKGFAAECHALRMAGRPGKVKFRVRSELLHALDFTDKDFIGARFTASQAGTEIKTHTFCGDPVKVLKDFSKLEQFDLVIVTPMKGNKLKETLLGSHIDYLLRVTKASVLVAK